MEIAEMKIDQFLSEFKVKNSKPKKTTRDTYGFVLKPLAQYLDAQGLKIENLFPGDFEEFISHQSWGNSHQRTCYFATRSYLRWDGFDPKSNPHPLHDFKLDKEEPMAGRTLRHEQFVRLLEVASETRLPTMATRNRAVLWTMWHTLIRASEVCRVEVKHVDLPGRTLQVRTKAKAGKPRSPQTKHLFAESAQAIADWLAVRGNVATSGMTDKLFISQALEVEGELTRAGLQALFYRLGDAAGFKVSPHDLRRGGASYLVEQGVPARLVKSQGGWRSWNVFNRYTAGAQLAEMDRFLGVEQPIPVEIPARVSA